MLWCLECVTCRAARRTYDSRKKKKVRRGISYEADGNSEGQSDELNEGIRNNVTQYLVSEIKSADGGLIFASRNRTARVDENLPVFSSESDYIENSDDT